MKIEGLIVKHKTLGIGTVTKFDASFLTVAFENKTSFFPYPSIFTTFLQAADPADHAAILQEIEDAKAAIIAQQKADEEAKRVEAEKLAAEAAKKKLASKSSSVPKAVSTQVRISGKPMTFYVFQGITFEQEYQGGYLWAPVTNKAGDTFHHWDRLLDARPGDVILHGYNGHVQAVSIVRAACYDCVQPKELQTEDAWDLEGRRLDCDYIMLKNPIKTANYIADILRLCNTKYSPFNKYGTGNMGYLYEIHREMAKIFLDAAVSANPYLKGNKVIMDLLSE
jgi:hypothetical protein